MFFIKIFHVLKKNQFIIIIIIIIIIISFATKENDIHKHTCNECLKDIAQNLSKGYSNLLTHVKTQHKDEYVEKIKARKEGTVRGPLDAFVRKATDKARNIFGWIDWIVTENLPLNTCANRNFRKRTSLIGISQNTLKKYVAMLEKNIKKKSKIEPLRHMDSSSTVGLRDLNTFMRFLLLGRMNFSL